MEMSVKIKLNSGKEIELTSEEYEELKGSFVEVEEAQRPFPYYPYYPNEITIPSILYRDGTFYFEGGTCITNSSGSEEEGMSFDTTILDAVKGAIEKGVVDEAMKNHYGLETRHINNWD